MDKGCKTCAHAGTPTYKSPCSECVASGIFNEWTARSCQNCTHRFLTADVEPCKTCFADKSFPKYYAMWESMLTDTELAQTAEDAKPDTVNHPAHYTECSLECIDVMLAVFGRKAVTDFCILNAFKYMWRYEHKNGLEDLQKAERYLAMAGNFQMADKEQENRIINMKAVLEILMRRVDK